MNDTPEQEAALAEVRAAARAYEQALRDQRAARVARADAVRAAVAVGVTKARAATAAGMSPQNLNAELKKF